MCFMFICSLELCNKVIHVSRDDNQCLFILYVYKQKQEPKSFVHGCVCVWVCGCLCSSLWLWVGWVWVKMTRD